ncbi:GGDEF domain-containing protein [Acidovorax lacteus]|uniref:diguanylate cyclase n=1 Tax=Acidovorax lacteus TaxID=1924988 RepID=A0ABP8L068_9BURK
MNLKQTLQRWRDEDRLVLDAACQRNLQVLGVAAWAMVALNLLHVAVFAVLSFDDPVQAAWARQIAWAHAGMALVMGAAGFWTRSAARQHHAPGLRYVPILVCAAVLCWAVLLTVFDQAIGSHINAFINAAMGVSIVFLLRPVVVVALLALGWAALAWALGSAIQDPAVLATHRMNAASASGLASLVSVLLWRRWAQTELLQRALTASNAELERQRSDMEALATRDPLTGLLNRREWVRLTEQALLRAQRQGAPLSLLMVDLDHFKAVNDVHGHSAGDDVLRLVASTMADTVRQTDCLARFGGEEFVLLLPDTPATSALLLAERVRVRLAEAPPAVPGVHVTASIGVATWSPGQEPALQRLLQQADEAMYEAKRQGRNRTVAAPA